MESDYLAPKIGRRFEQKREDEGDKLGVMWPVLLTMGTLLLLFLVCMSVYVHFSAEDSDVIRPSFPMHRV